MCNGGRIFNKVNKLCRVSLSLRRSPAGSERTRAGLTFVGGLGVVAFMVTEMNTGVHFLILQFSAGCCTGDGRGNSIYRKAPADDSSESNFETTQIWHNTLGTNFFRYQLLRAFSHLPAS